MDTYPPYYLVSNTYIYHVSKHSSSHYGSLIDWGANGGLAGSDVRILERTGLTVSVTGIGNNEHQAQTLLPVLPSSTPIMAK